LLASTLAELLLTGGRLLLLLNKIAKRAAAGNGDVLEAAALEVIFAPDVGALERFRNPVETEASRGREKKAGGVDWLVALKGAVLASAVVNLAEGYARQAVGEQARVDRAAAAEEARAPLTGISWAGSSDLVGVGESIIEAGLPVLNIMRVDETRLG